MSDLEREIRREIAERGELDWISMAEMFDVARSLGAEKPRQTAIDLAVTGADEGALVVGRYANGQGFIPWPERGDSLRRRILAALADNPADDPLPREMTVMIDTL